MGTEHVTVKEVGEGRPWQHGITYYEVGFDRNGSAFTCDWGKKDEAPQPGEQVEGEFFKKGDDWRFRKAPGNFEASTSQPLSLTSSQPSGKTPDVQRQITRQHSQEMALRTLALLAPDVPVSDEQIKEWADFFDADVFGKAAIAGQEQPNSSGDSPIQGSSDSAQPAQRSQPAEPDDTHRLDEKLDSSGVVDPDERRWLIERAYQTLSGDKQKVCLAALVMGDPEGQSKAVARLREIAGPMPPDVHGDTIPF